MKHWISFIIGAAIAAGVLWLLKPVEPENINWQNLSDQQIVANMQSATLQEVHQYVDWVHEEELSRSYVIPAHVANARGIQKAQAAVDHRYPQFQNVYNDDLLSAVRQNPLLYRDYIRETKSIRKRFVRKQE